MVIVFGDMKTFLIVLAVVLLGCYMLQGQSFTVALPKPVIVPVTRDVKVPSKADAAGWTAYPKKVSGDIRRQF